MASEIIMKTILTIVGFIVTGILGYFVAKIKEHKNQEGNQQKALKCLLRSSITKIYYKYTELGYIPRYEKENVIYLYEQYKAMDGNSYINSIIKEIENLTIKS